MKCMAGVKAESKPPLKNRFAEGVYKLFPEEFSRPSSEFGRELPEFGLDSRRR